MRIHPAKELFSEPVAAAQQEPPYEKTPKKGAKKQSHDFSQDCYAVTLSAFVPSPLFSK